MASFSAVARFSAVDRFSSVLAKMESNNKRFASSSDAAFKKAGAGAIGLQNSVSGLVGQLKGMATVVSVAALMTMGAQAVMEYDTAIASLSAVTGVSGKALADMESQVQSIAKSTKKSSAEVAGGFEIVGSAMSQYLSDPKALGTITNEGILLAKASKMQLEPALLSLTGAMNQFNLGADQAAKTVNILTAGEIVGSVSTAKSVDELSKFGAVANSMNTTLPESIALIQVLGKKLPTEEIGTASRNLLLFMDTSKGASSEATEAFKRNGVSLDILSNKNLTTADRLRELSKVQNDSVAMSKIFGKENITAGKVIFDQLDTYEAWVKEIGATEKAQEQAAKNSATIAVKLTEVKNAFDNAIVGVINGGVGMSMFSGVLTFVADNLDIVVNLIAGLAAVIIPAYVAYKAITLATLAYNFALAAQTIIAGKGAMALKGNAMALKAYGVITKTLIAIQWAWNAAMAANPIGLIVVAIVAVIAVIALLVKYWDTIKAKFESSTGWVKGVMTVFALLAAPILMVVNTISKLINSWDYIKKAFTDGGFVAGLKAIGGVLLSALIDPMIFFLKLLAKIPGLGGMIDPLIGDLKNYQIGLEGGDAVTAPKEPISMQATQNKVTSEQIKESRQSVDINIKDPNNRANTTATKGAVPVTVNGTTAQF